MISLRRLVGGTSAVQNLGYSLVTPTLHRPLLVACTVLSCSALYMGEGGGGGGGGGT